MENAQDFDEQCRKLFLERHEILLDHAKLQHDNSKLWRDNEVAKEEREQLAHKTYMDKLESAERQQNLARERDIANSNRFIDIMERMEKALDRLDVKKG